MSTTVTTRSDGFTKPFDDPLTRANACMDTLNTHLSTLPVSDPTQGGYQVSVNGRFRKVSKDHCRIVTELNAGIRDTQRWKKDADEQLNWLSSQREDIIKSLGEDGVQGGAKDREHLH
ncbi:uncharacterized protein I303_103605 [Kwoniella dejecticola CBS 10117]|uniref:Uncharacterized protein n=1 Tax=Kwoniella dejecticola CBS 10117 TaxID=1296121 RepID=A0A1A6A778_9TREE|nr:uncharacterized protein I303_03627 [Kwoniella dejecticola CBS 10117]OBR85912.1 hypothetical protein I303_03627 [Kwoniella dejecticola CBS 10117]